MRLRSGRTKVEREKTADDLMVERIKAQYLIKRSEKEALRRLIGRTRWWVVCVVAGYFAGLIFKSLWNTLK